MQLNNLNLIKEFIEKCPNFWKEDLEFIDKKHKYILKRFSDIYKNDLKKFEKNLIDWEEHNDHGAPYQLTFQHFQILELKQILIDFLKEVKRNIISNQFDKSSFLDDIEIIKKEGAFELLKEFPAHKNYFRKKFYFIEKNISANYRWLRYIYISNKIIKNNLIKEGSVWLDIGSFYGGLQGIIKSKFLNSKIFLVDFNHQLCRSYVYLKNLFPNSNHILPSELRYDKDLSNIKDNSIVYIKAKDFHKLNFSKIDLLTNFFSFGEMNKKTFESYYNSDKINRSKIIYLVNRFISSPFFEPSYESNINIFDYKKDFYNTDYLDIFPMHHYYKHPRKIFGRHNKRPSSSPCFEMILKIKKNTD